MTETPLELINQTAWAEWTQWRKSEKKKPVTNSARRKQWKMLALYTLADQQRIIDTSIMNDWQGLFPAQTAKTSTRANSLEHDLTDRSWAL